VNRDDDGPPPILRTKHPGDRSVFRPENLLREGRRQLGKSDGAVPRVCLLDPDGDIVRHLKREGLGQPCGSWACYHTELLEFAWEGAALGVVGFAVDAPFAVLVGEQLFASGCELLLSITSAGQIAPVGPTPCFVAIERALRDEGTSYHYLPPSDFSEVDGSLLEALKSAFEECAQPVHGGPTWTTDAPYRETEAAIAAAREAGVLAVEMEAAALYAFARASGNPVLCFAHVTNQMAVAEGDFEKGEAGGSRDALSLAAAVARRWTEVRSDSRTA